MDTYTMQHYDVTVPAVNNAGEPSGYAAAFRAGLLAADIDGWTEHRSVGYWHGKREGGTVFTFYVFGGDTAISTLGPIARAAMPDQEAVQVVDHGTITLAEA